MRDERDPRQPDDLRPRGERPRGERPRDEAAADDEPLLRPDDDEPGFRELDSLQGIDALGGIGPDGRVGPEGIEPGAHDAADRRPAVDAPRPAWERRPPRSPWPWIAGVLALLALIAAGTWYVFFRPPPPPPPVPEPAAPAPLPPAVPRPEPAEEEIELPPLDASDALVAELAAALSSRPELARWLATDGLVRRFTAAVDNVADGVSPRPHLKFLAPEEPFAVTGGEAGAPLRVDPESYRRYDTLAAVFASLDTAGTVRLLHRSRPLLDEAYRELGYPDTPFDSTLERAITHLLAVPVPTEPPRLVPGVGRFDYADPELETLTPAQKDLLRMGPANIRRIQAKLRELAAAL